MIFAQKHLSYVCFMRFEDRDFKKCSFVCGKSYLTLLKRQMLIVLKLAVQLAVMTTTLKATIPKSLKISIYEVHFWTD